MKSLNALLIGAPVLLLSANIGWGLPYLQEDILGGVYDTTTETTVATSDPFTLRVLANQTNSDFSKGGFYISATILPSSASTLFGSFKVGSTTYSASAGGHMQYGTPPVDSEYPDLASHGIYPAYYAEIGFTFNPLNLIAAYNTQDHTSAPGNLTYEDFLVDASGLSAGDVVHFDFYQTEIDLITGKKHIITHEFDTNFAPFSHDAESKPRTSVPDQAGTWLLVIIGFIGSAFFSVRPKLLARVRR